ncbi:hypothetical protein [Sinorhizobium sp. BG8]|uniref:hypothetical protein n=1 Tax=Sinorhizobium sp. BG8 TaxID=2613773 RepID=UPI00193D2DF7|nr:hypothetical protein [Sinorhizobium sp. BG8]QRM55279.1 hypothetical protein F3Y30_12600 [Sinorhizobium sp. BG8]
MQTSKHIVYGMVGFNILLAAWLSLHMLYDPEGWYYFVPGVTDTGMFNQHFVRDIGIIQGFVALAFAVGLWKPHRRLELWAGATLWLIAHAAFHLWEVAVGICSASVIIRDFPAVSLPAIFGVAATIWAYKQVMSVPIRRESGGLRA